MSDLSVAAAGMSPGTWLDFPTTNFNFALIHNEAGSNGIFTFTNSCVWDSVAHRIYATGGPHNPSMTRAGTMSTITYEESTNTWSVIDGYTDPPGVINEAYWINILSAAHGNAGIGNHGFEAHTIDSARRKYYMLYGGSGLHYVTWDLALYPTFDAGVWNETDVGDLVGATTSVGPGQCFFPDLDGGQGGLVNANFQAGPSVFVWHRQTNTWQTLLTFSEVMAGGQGYHQVAEWNSFSQCVAVGGGNGYRGIAVVRANGTYEDCSPIPTGIDPGVTGGKLFPDPASGKFLCLNHDDTFWEFNPAPGLAPAARWLQLPNPPAPLRPWSSAGESIHECVVAGIDNYGVSVVLDSTNYKVWLYKHGTFTPPVDAAPPTISLTAPANGATVSGSVSVTATAADDVGVVGVQFLLDGGSLNAEDMTAPYAITWDTTTTTDGPHTLSARARDAVGNQTTSATRSVTVNNGVAPINPKLAMVIR